MLRGTVIVRALAVVGALTIGGLAAPSASSGHLAESGSYSRSAPELGHIPSPWGPLHLDPAAADAWNAMRAESLSAYGIDLQPSGTRAAFRGYAEQAQLYDDYLSGSGARAASPGTSSHESGRAVDVASKEMHWVIDQIGWKYGWGRTEAPDEWWHFTYAGG